jgi:hypothetical protein
MIESGLSNFVLGNAAIQPFLGQSPQDAENKIFEAFYYSFLPKNRTLPAVVLDRIKSDDADDTLDARTALPGVLIEATFQFGSMAEDNPKNPKSPSGYLSACLLSQQLRRQLMGLATGSSVLPDGTLVKDVRIMDEYDAHFELGGGGYLLRRVLLIGMLFQEVS